MSRVLDEAGEAGDFARAVDALGLTLALDAVAEGYGCPVSLEHAQAALLRGLGLIRGRGERGTSRFLARCTARGERVNMVYVRARHRAHFAGSL